MRKPKYTIGDSVFFMQNNIVKKKVVKGVILEKYPATLSKLSLEKYPATLSKLSKDVFGDDIKPASYAYTFDILGPGNQWTYERDLYKTKEDLINSL